MRQASGSLSVRTRGRGLVDITEQVGRWLDAHPGEGQSIVTGLVTLFCTHTSASLLIQENASPALSSTWPGAACSLKLESLPPSCQMVLPLKWLTL